MLKQHQSLECQILGSDDKKKGRLFYFFEKKKKTSIEYIYRVFLRLLLAESV